MLPVLNSFATKTENSKSSLEVNQVSHGFVDGDWLRHDGTNYVLASALTGLESEVLGVVDKVINNDKFKLVFSGLVTLYGLTAGTQYLSDTSGQISNVEGTISKVVGLAISSNSMLINIHRGVKTS